MYIPTNQTKTLNALITLNDKGYNILKACEELAELQEKLLKKYVKAGTPKEPSDESVVEEIGDVFIRLSVIEQLFQASTQARVEFKLNKFEEYLKEGKYKGRI